MAGPPSKNKICAGFLPRHSPKILRHAESASMATAVTTPPDHQSAPFSEAAGPCAMVLFGASGGLTKRKLAPAPFNLAQVLLLPQNFSILGVAIWQLDWKSQRL